MHPLVESEDIRTLRVPADMRDGVLIANWRRPQAYRYEATTVAQIAERAGRTQGAIYSNFAGKDDLGFAVLQRRFLSEATRLSEFVGGAVTLEERIDAVSRWWSDVLGQQDLFVLVAEYGLAARRAGTSPTSVGVYAELVEEFLRTHVGPQFDPEPDQDAGEVARRGDRMSTAIIAVVATATGLAVCQLFGAIDQELSSKILADTVRHQVLSR